MRATSAGWQKNWGFLYKAICADPNIDIDLARLISAISIGHPIKIEVLFFYNSEYFLVLLEPQWSGVYQAKTQLFETKKHADSRNEL